MESHCNERTVAGLTDFRRPVYCLLGLPVDAVNRKQAIARIASSVATGTSCFMSTPNLNFLIASLSDSEFRDTVIHSDLSVADGMPLVWIGRLLGMPIRERVAGSDLFEDLARGEAGEIKIFFFGGREGFARRATERLNGFSGAMRSVGDLSPGFGTIEEMSRPAMIEQINHSGADFLLVGLPAAKGQRWIQYNRNYLEVPIIASLGAVINFVAGTLQRAPLLMQKTGVEWLWRIKEEPVLWRRYFSDGLALLTLIVTKVLPAMAYRLFARIDPFLVAPNVMVEAPALSLDREGKHCIRSCRVKISGSWSDLDLLRTALEQATLHPGNIEVDMTDLGWIDGAFIGLLMLLYGHQKKLGFAYLVLRPNKRICRLFKLYCAEFLLNEMAALAKVSDAVQNEKKAMSF